MKINETIFKAYDIRGAYPEEINGETAYFLGKAIASIFSDGKIIIGRDSRSSSKILFKSLSEGLIDQGVSVIDIGLTTSPIFNFSVAGCGAGDLGIMITASHLDSDHNGFKIVDNKAMPLSIEQREKIKEVMIKNKYISSNKKGVLKKINPHHDYLQKLFSLIKTPCDELSEIAKKIKFTVEYDQDKDRIIFFDEQGEKIAGDLITAFLSKYLLQEHQGEKIIFTINSSKIVPEEITKNGGKATASRVGHSFIKKKMKEENALFGGEVSGHYYFRDFYFCECPDLVLLKVLEIIKKSSSATSFAQGYGRSKKATEDKGKKTLRELIKPFKKYYSTGELNFKVKNKDKKIEEVNQFFKDAKKSFLDGLTCELDDWWFNLRPSHTEGVIRLTMEANTKEVLDQEKNKLIKLIKR